MGEWKTVKLAEVLRYRKGNILISNDEEYSLCRVQLHRRGVVLRERKIGSQIKTKKQQVCRAGDLVVAEMDAKFGGYGFIPDHLEGAIVSSHYYLYELDKNKITQEYFEILIKTDFIQNQIEAKGSTNYSSIRAWEFLDYEIPLQSIALQNIIAAKYLKHSRFKEDLGVELNAQLQYLSQLRQAVLQEAIEGKLTADWRKQNPKLISGENHASKLLEKIKAEKERLIKEGKIKKDKPLAPIADDEKPFDLPEGWVWCRLGEVSDLITKGSSPNWQGIRYVDRGAGVRFITSKNVGIYNVDLTDETFVEARFNEIEPRSILEKGDILTNIVGASIGRTAIYELDEIANINQAVCLIRISSKLIDKQYVIHWMNSPFLIAKMHEDEFAPGRANLSMGNVAGFLLAIAPSAEQSKMIDRLDQLMIVVDELEKQVSERKEQTEMLMQSVLREAFAGEGKKYG